MQTFLPLPSFAESAAVLDRQRLGKQRVETMQLLKALTDPSAGWQHHPAVTMWRGHEAALIEYGVAICREWISRGYKDTCLEKIQAFADGTQPATLPAWFGDPAFHEAHRSNLLRKAPEHYRQFWPDEDDALEYVWPGKDGDNGHQL